MNTRTIAEASELIRHRKISPVELVRECLHAIDQLNPSLNAFITVMGESAAAEAKQAEEEIRAGNWRGPLHGIPIGLKDLIDTAGVRTTAASAVFLNRVPREDAEVVKQLKAAGAIIIGKQNLHEFAYGGSSLISHFGPVRNPVNPKFIAGGSSGGSAAAVASGMCYAAIGTDTAGSIREPAALCGVVGLKPSYGLVSTKGVIPLSVSLDHVGPITRTVEDAAILLDVLTKNSARYRECLQEQRRNLVIGVPRAYFFEDLDAETAGRVEVALDCLASSGFVVTDIEVRVNEDRTLQKAEAFEFHRRMIAEHGDLYDPETRRRILSGKDVTPEQWESAFRELSHEREKIATLFHAIDVLITPTTPISAPRISDLMADPKALRPAELILLRNTRPVNVWGLPAISIPCGFTSGGLPIGLQIIGPPHGEMKVVQVARAYERAV
ncbi:MAG TPA: amidase [Terriglobales bacterium]|jgi:Asp-tRNA(Asn)/Glu-tRNA(Gln) amidotransferase A subunit family amidase